MSSSKAEECEEFHKVHPSFRCSTIAWSDTASSNNTDLKINQNRNKKEAAKNMTLSLVVNSWRLKRREVKSLREILAARTSSEERLRRQTQCLKQLLQADHSRLTAAMASVRQASQLQDDSKAFENEKSALQKSVNLAEQRASGLQELWRSCKADLAAARLQAAQAHAFLTAERVKHRVIREQNAELLERITQNEEEKKCLQSDLQEANSEILQLKELVNTKEGHLQSLETELICQNRNLKQKDMDTQCKDNELKMESLKTKELTSQIEEFKCQLRAAHEKLQRWPFYLAPSWSPCAPVASWWGHLTQRLLNVAMIFATR